MNKIVITGGAGFIGSNLCDHFILRGDQVTVLDNFATGFKHNIVNLFIHPIVVLIEGDIRTFETWQNACVGADYVLH